MKRLTDYHRPGNIRELRHVIERALILNEGRSLKIAGMGEYATPPGTADEFVSLKEMERPYIVRVPAASGWKVSGKENAAEIMGMKPTTLHSRIRRPGIRKNLGYGSQ